MRRSLGSLGFALALPLLVPTLANAQVPGFSPRQNSSLFMYQAQAAQANRSQQRQQLQSIQQQFKVDRQDNQTVQQTQQHEINQLLGVEPMDPRGPQSMRRGTAVFGDPHFNSGLFNRTSPYYDYAFIQRRNKAVPININGANRPQQGFGTLILGGGFGVFAVPY